MLADDAALALISKWRAGDFRGLLPSFSTTVARGRCPVLRTKFTLELLANRRPDKLGTGGIDVLGLGPFLERDDMEDNEFLRDRVTGWDTSNADGPERPFVDGERFDDNVVRAEPFDLTDIASSLDDHSDLLSGVNEAS